MGLATGGLIIGYVLTGIPVVIAFVFLIIEVWMAYFSHWRSSVRVGVVSRQPARLVDPFQSACGSSAKATSVSTATAPVGARATPVES
jgi:hypothetical protein